VGSEWQQPVQVAEFPAVAVKHHPLRPPDSRARFWLLFRCGAVIIR